VVNCINSSDSLAIGAIIILYEQQQVKTHLIDANNYHIQMLANKPALAATNSLDEKLSIWNKNVPLLNSELTELRAADTMFASPQQKQYISVTIQLNGDNMALYNVIFRFGKDDNSVNNINSTPEHQTSNLNLLTRFICHRIPERTFNIRGHYFPVCSRCTGFYIAAFSYFIFVYFFYVHYTVMLIIFAIIMIIPTFLDGFTQLIGSRESNNILRLCTGLIGGIGLGILIKAIKWIILTGGH